ncbi:hypothetical protein VE00_07355 [Pseudogymnoascus sp. WSF 3629]|nr:hypothetical protein VE00_07355 [Pseudogymnoascus sp. WSF 3629]
MPPKQESGNNVASQNQESNSNASSDSPPPTNYRIVKDGWGDRPNFQHSFGLPMTPGGIEEGNRILDGFREDYMEDRKEAKKSASGGGGEAAEKAEKAEGAK